MPVDSTLILIPHIHQKSVLIGTSEKELFARVMWITAQNADKGEWIRLSNGLREWKLPEIKPGEQGLLKVIAVRNGKLFAKEHHIENPLPKDSIDVKIATFRDHLIPGSKDTWTISLSQKGRPVSSASTLAFMYDASLDEIIKHNPVLTFRRPELYLPDYLREGSCFFDKSIYDLGNNDFDFYNRWNDSRYTRPAFSFSMKPNAFIDSKLHYGIQNNSIADVFIEEEISSAVDRDVKTGDMGNTPTLRSNFADCAFFYPNLPVSNEGKVTFSFTLPDLITTWRFVAITNNEKMEVGQIQQSFVAKKELMLQIN
ncbi:MAG: alpha-2-macroglobulin family protein, partial [Bacteroidales bacterium]